MEEVVEVMELGLAWRAEQQVCGEFVVLGDLHSPPLCWDHLRLGDLQLFGDGSMDVWMEFVDVSRFIWLCYTLCYNGIRYR